jgi:ketosteroid isomerase-like protein
MRNHLTMTVLTEDGEPALRRSGYTLSILCKEPDGRWVLARDANLLGKQS